MKPVISSIVALTIAIAPLTSLAGEKSTHEKPTLTKVVKSAKDDKAAKQKTGKVQAKTKPVHHAHGVLVGSAGHAEPKAENTITRASLTTKGSKTAQRRSSEVSHHNVVAELPRLPDPNASKASASKSNNEKGVHRAATTKKSDPDDGRLERDEDLADLVARIAGHRSGAAAIGANVRLVSHKSVCMKDKVQMIRGPEIDSFELATCDGSVAPLAVERLSIVVRPGSAARPTTSAAELAKKKGPELAPGIRRVDARLALRLQSIVDHFAKPHEVAKLNVISGYRPTSVGSMHASGRAIDFRFEGVPNEEVVAFCKTLADTGCGYYPNSSFVHVDVRDPGKGHVTWIDVSGPGESPRYVDSWPPPNPAGSDGVENATATEPVAPSTDSGAASGPVIDELPSTPEKP
ncbi:MAG: DUF882 domain-containing protein [Polyangiaceae bacterium]|nr:DUF882 domain-containing protein [Polyangiaceae bacterium]